jgi:hypothetical protein
MSVRVHKTLAILLLSGLAGCASGPFHRKTVPPPALQPQPPELSQSPLYSPEMSENNPRTPTLPTQETAVVVVKQPEPPPVKPHKPHKTKPLPAAPKGSNGDADTAASAPSSSGGAGVSPPAPATEKRPQEAQQAKGLGSAPSPIGELTTGDSAEVAQTSHQASELIRVTREGMEAIKRTLSKDEKKTMIEIGSFLTRADQALRNGDVDGAYGLATKAKILLDELTQN